MHTTPIDQPSRILLALLRGAMWGRDRLDLSLFPLSPALWRQVYEAACMQTVAGLAFEGMQMLPPDLQPSDPGLALQWAARVQSIEERSADMERAVASLFGQMQSQGLDPVLLKGLAVARMYAHPSMRQSGDIDVWLPTREQLRQALPAGAVVHVDGSCNYDFCGMPVELHLGMMDICDPRKARIVDQVVADSGFDAIDVLGQPVLVPSGAATLLMLSAHILKHVFGHGIGLRQMCDMAVACRYYSGRVDPAQLKDFARRLSLLDWNRRLHAFLVECLGMPRDYLPYDDQPGDCSRLVDIVFDGGNFGMYGSHYRQGQSLVRSKLQTIAAFVRNFRFSMSNSPSEAMWYYLHIIKGQFRCRG